MRGFKYRLQSAIEESDYKDVYELANVAGLGTKTIYNMLKDPNLDNTKAGPGIFNMARVASLLGTSLDYLAGIAPPVSKPLSDRVCQSNPLAAHTAANLAAQEMTKGAQPSADGLLRLYWTSGGQLAAFADHLDYCDQYEPCAPTDMELKVIAVGRKSLAAITMGHPSSELLQTAINSVADENLRAGWIKDYSDTLEFGPKVSLETLDVQMPNHPVRVKMDFIRALLPVTDSDGRRRLLNYSLLMV